MNMLDARKYFPFSIFFILNNGLVKILEANKFITGLKTEESTENNYAVIFFHGLGEDGISWIRRFADMKLPNTDIILPTAKRIRVTLANGEMMPAWFDFIDSDKIDVEDDEFGIRRSLSFANNLICKEIKRGVLSSNIIIGGFDQGGAVALHVGLRFKEKLAGIIALSTWFPHYNKFNNSWVTKNHDIPIFICHGVKDPIISLKHGKNIITRVKNLTNNVSFKLYDNLTHKTISEEMNAVSNFIKSKFKFK